MVGSLTKMVYENATFTCNGFLETNVFSMLKDLINELEWNEICLVFFNN